MSKNPAWGTYNETIAQVNQDYDEFMKPLRANLSRELEDVEKRASKKMEPIILERDKATKALKGEFTKLAEEAEKKRNGAIKRAREVLNAELEAKKKEAQPA